MRLVGSFLNIINPFDKICVIESEIVHKKISPVGPAPISTDEPPVSEGVKYYRNSQVILKEQFEKIASKYCVGEVSSLMPNSKILKQEGDDITVRNTWGKVYLAPNFSKITIMVSLAAAIFFATKYANRGSAN